MRKVAVLVFISLCCHSSWARPNREITPRDTLFLSLSDAWTKAEANSRMIEIKRKATDVAAEEYKDARLELFLPEVGIKGTAEKASNIPIYENGLFSKPSQHEVIHTLYHVGADFYQILYHGNKMRLKIREDKTLQQLASIEEDKMLSDIRYQTAALYLEVQKSLIFKDLIIQDIADQEKQLEEIQALYRNGTVLKSDVLRIELDLSKRRMALITIENDILIATQKLNIIMGEADDQPIKPMAPLLSEQVHVSYEEALKQALEQAFDYRISEKQTQLSELHLKQVRANVRPHVGLYGDFYYANPQIFLAPYNPYWYSLGVIGIKASYPISALYHNIHKTRAAKLELEKEEVAHHDTEDRVRQQVNEAYLRYTEALKQIAVEEVNVKQATENARIIKNTYFNQTALITDLLDADIQLLQTRFDLAAARIIAQDKFYLLQNIIGIL